jgi:hypothetical protein
MLALTSLLLVRVLRFSLSVRRVARDGKYARIRLRNASAPLLQGKPSAVTAQTRRNRPRHRRTRRLQLQWMSTVPHRKFSPNIPLAFGRQPADP